MAYSLDVDQLRTFLAIAELGSFSRAGEAVHKTQSAVSMQMRKLEERVGKPIFVKDGRNSKLSREGYRLLEYASRMVALNDETLNAFEETESSGTIRLGLPDDYVERLLPQVLASFGRINPSVMLEVECNSSAYIRDRIDQGELDVGLVTSGCELTRKGIHIRRESLHWITATNNPMHKVRPLRVATGPVTCCWRSSAIQRLDKAKIPHVIVFSSHSASALFGAVQAGLGVGILPDSAIRSEHRIVGEREGLPQLPPCDITLIRSDGATDPLYQTLVDHIIASIGNVSYRAVAAE
ncbi:LysR substrate-binding domain-containing protein [Flexibacterium corallicola]|uniref:LysR substrate-binding domain-containing protein n=1 Tax=Flexibacterium corallicola TaxID=3037259 RepID=UPI00286EB921|nr:LysR substrate-binding domain-containing protein [Pseudovibrio sp. M1P-2-3]